MSKTAIIVNFLEGLSDSQKAEIGSSDQVMIKLRETDERTKIEFYDTVTQAETRKTEWEDS